MLIFSPSFLICVDFFILWQCDYSFIFISLDPIKSLLTKLQKCYQDMHKAYHMHKAYQKNWKNIEMTLTINFNISVTLLSGKRKRCHWTQPTTFNKILELMQIKYQENLGDTILERYQSVWDWRTKIMAMDLLFYNLNVFWEFSSRKQFLLTELWG